MSDVYGMDGGGCITHVAPPSPVISPFLKENGITTSNGLKPLPLTLLLAGSKLSDVTWRTDQRSGNNKHNRHAAAISKHPPRARTRAHTKTHGCTVGIAMRWSKMEKRME